MKGFLMWIKAMWGRVFRATLEPEPSVTAHEAKLAFDRGIEAALGVDRELRDAAVRLRENRAKRIEALRKLEMQ